MNTTIAQVSTGQEMDKQQYAEMAEEACGIFLDAAIPGSLTQFRGMELLWLDVNTLSITPNDGKTQIWIRVPGGEIIGVNHDQSRKLA